MASKDEGNVSFMELALPAEGATWGQQGGSWVDYRGREMVIGYRRSVVGSDFRLGQ